MTRFDISSIYSHPFITQSRSSPSTRPFQIKKILNPHHPAYGEYGLFASQTLVPDSLVLNYVGCVDLYSKANDSSNYSMNYIRGIHGLPDLVIDAEKMGNESRFINDSRGISDKPNAKFELYKDKSSRTVQVGVWVLKNKISKGEEILVSYGKGFWNHRQSRE